MTWPLDQIALASALFRIGRTPNPWAWPDWAKADLDGTFGNRWDDPGNTFRVLYAATERRTTFLEILSRYRPDPAVIADLQEIAGDDDSSQPGCVPRTLFNNRRLGEATVSGTFADIGSAHSLAHLRQVMAPRLVHYEIHDLDASAIKSSVPRRFTQELSRYVYELTDISKSRRSYDGISYSSRLGDDLQNWAIFEPASAAEGDKLIKIMACSKIQHDDPDLLWAIKLLGLTLV